MWALSEVYEAFLNSDESFQEGLFYTVTFMQ